MAALKTFAKPYLEETSAQLAMFYTDLLFYCSGWNCFGKKLLEIKLLCSKQNATLYAMSSNEFDGVSFLPKSFMHSMYCPQSAFFVFPRDAMLNFPVVMSCAQMLLLLLLLPLLLVTWRTAL